MTNDLSKRCRGNTVIKRAPTAPAVGSRWIHIDCKRSVIVVGIRSMIRVGPPAQYVEYRYIQGLGGSNLWKRGVTPTQSVAVDDWHRRFKPEPMEKR